MKFCQQHWESLHDQVKAAGLPIAPDAEAAALMVAEGQYDALISAHNRVAFHAIYLLGMELMESDECPVCACSEACTCGKPNCCDWYLKMAVDEEIKQYAKRKPS